MESVTPVLGNLHPSAILDNLHFNCSQQLIEQNQHKQTDGLDTSQEKSEPRAVAQCALVVYLNIVCSVRAQSVILWTLVLPASTVRMLFCLLVVTETNGASITIDADATVVDDMEKKTSRLQIMFSLSRVRPIDYRSYTIPYERPQAMFVYLTHVYICTPPTPKHSAVLPSVCKRATATRMTGFDHSSDQPVHPASVDGGGRGAAERAGPRAGADVRLRARLLSR